MYKDQAYGIRLLLEGIDPITSLLFISEPPPPQTLTRVTIWPDDDEGEEEGWGKPDLSRSDGGERGDGGERPAVEEGEDARGSQGLRGVPGGHGRRGGRDVPGGGEGIPREVRAAAAWSSTSWRKMFSDRDLCIVISAES